MMDDGLMRQADAARYLGISRQRVWELIQAGRLHTIRLYGQRLVERAGVEVLKRRREGQKDKASC